MVKKKHGLNLSTGFLSDYTFDKKPNIIIYSHVLEHVLDLSKELQAIKNSISESSIVYIEVPGIKEVHKNYKSDILKYFQNAHTFHFTLESLVNLFSKDGFKLIDGNQFVQSAFKYKGIKQDIKSDYKASKEYILKIEKNRKLYIFTFRGMKGAAKGVLRLILKKLKTLR